MCRGIEESEVKRIKQGLYVSDGMFYMSRLYVPYFLFRMYRLGIFQESFSLLEVRLIVRIIIVMHLLDLAGHSALRYMTKPIIAKHLGLMNEFGYA
jgi:hypothetical protein